MNRWDPSYRPIERSPKGINKIQVGPPSYSLSKLCGGDFLRHRYPKITNDDS